MKQNIAINCNMDLSLRCYGAVRFWYHYIPTEKLRFFGFCKYVNSPTYQTGWLVLNQIGFRIWLFSPFLRSCRPSATRTTPAASAVWFAPRLWTAFLLLLTITVTSTAWQTTTSESHYCCLLNFLTAVNNAVTMLSFAAHLLSPVKLFAVHPAGPLPQSALRVYNRYYLLRWGHALVPVLSSALIDASLFLTHCLEFLNKL